MIIMVGHEEGGKGAEREGKEIHVTRKQKGVGREEARLKMGAHGFHVCCGDSNSGPHAALQVFSLPTEHFPSTCMIN